LTVERFHSSCEEDKDLCTSEKFKIEKISGGKKVPTEKAFFCLITSKEMQFKD
jgi:hypothetical protein